jgi:hypothetical protein
LSRTYASSFGDVAVVEEWDRDIVMHCQNTVTPSATPVTQVLGLLGENVNAIVVPPYCAETALNQLA